MDFSSAPVIPTTTISAVHPDIIQTHILSHLDGPSLASAASTSSQLYALSSDEHLWANLCHSTWPSTATSRLHHVISTFPRGSLSFFSDSFPLVHTCSDPTDPNSEPNPISEFISAVDVHYRGKLVFSKVVESETKSAWFRCTPFGIDLLEPKDLAPILIKYPNSDGMCKDLGEELRLSWILIDPRGKRAVNVSSRKAVSVQRHWLSGEIQVRFATILSGKKGSTSELVQCAVVLTCGGGEGEEMQLRETSLGMENMDGKRLNGRESMEILQKRLESKRRRKNGREEEEEGRKRYEEYLQRKREREERKVKKEGTLDMLCVALAGFSFVGFLLFVYLR